MAEMSAETGNKVSNILGQIDVYVALHLSDAAAVEFLDTLVDRIVSRIEDHKWDLSIAEDNARNEATA